MAKELHPGNAIASETARVQELVRLAEGLQRLDRLIATALREGAAWGNMTLKPPPVEGGEWLLIARAFFNNEHYVAFVSASTLVEALRLLAAKAENNTLKWKVDEYIR